MMPAFVRGENPIWYLPDLVGNPLNDMYYIFFLSNVFPYIPQVVYMDDAGVNPWPFPIEFQPGGTLPDNIYFTPDLAYRIEIRMGPSQTDQLIYGPIMDYIANGSGGNTPSINLSGDNLISNGQFAQVSFGYIPPASSPSLSITAAGTYNVAPGWQLILTGTGTATVNQVISTGNENIPTNPVPPYYLEIITAGWTSAILQQQFNGLGAIFSNTYVSFSVEAMSNNGIPSTISLVYTPQSPGLPVTIVPATALSTSGFTQIQNSVLIPTSANTNPNNTSYVDMQIILPTTGDVLISDIQVVQQDVPTPITYQQETIEEQTNSLFWYYSQDLIISPKKSILTGWNFSLNPWQFVTPTVTTQTAQTVYIADQTILHQEAVSQVATGQGSAAQRQGLVVQAVASAATTRFCVIQYIDPTTIRPYWSYVLSALVKCGLVTSHSTTVRLKARLIWRVSLPPTLSSSEPIASWGATDPVLATGWTYIESTNDAQYVLSGVTGEVFPSFSFNGFQLPAASATAMTLGIMVYTLDDMNSTSGSMDSIVFDKISLSPSHFAVDANPDTFDQVLRECQYYYEKSYDNSILPGTASVGSQITRWQTTIFQSGTGGWDLFPSVFEFEFNTVKRAIPAMLLYSPSTGSNGAVDASTIFGSPTPENSSPVTISNWVNTSFIGTKAVTYYPTTTSPILTSTSTHGIATPLTGIITFQFTASALLGS